jgi:aminopeptidase N
MKTIHAFFGILLSFSIAFCASSTDYRFDVGDEKLIDVHFYHIDIKLSLDSAFIQSKVKLGFKALKDASQLNLDFAQGFYISKIKGAKTWQYKDGKLIVQLEKTLLKGEMGTIEVQYQGRPPRATDGMVTKGLLWETHGVKDDEPIIVNLSTPFLAHFWFPCKDGPSDKADSVYVDITVKDTLINKLPVVGVSNGMLEDSLIANGLRTYKWRHRYPIAPYYVLVAASNFKRYAEPFTDPLGNTYKLEYFFFAENAEDAAVTFRRMPELMGFLTNTFGAYPFAKEKYGMTQIGFYSGIEKQTNAIVRDMKGTSLSTTVHEAAHMWWGNAMTPVDWSHAWLNEGMASYTEALWQQFRRGEEEYKKTMLKFTFKDNGSLILKDKDNPFRIFTPIVYNKGAWVMHMLRYVVGDKHFFDICKSFPQEAKYKHKNITTEDFQAYAEYVSQEDLEYFFKQWVYGESYPIYNFDWKQDANGASITIRQQKRSTTPAFFIMPIQLLVRTSTGEQMIRVFNNLPEESFKLDVKGTITEIIFDPNAYILKEVQWSRQILNDKTPMTLKLAEIDKSARKMTVQLDVLKKQDIVIEIQKKNGEVLQSNTFTKAEGNFSQVLDLKALDKATAYNLKLIGKSDVYTIDIQP